MAYPDFIQIDGVKYTVESEQAWTDIASQLENLMRTGRILLRIQSEDGERHVLVADGTSLNFWIEKD